jgi:alkylated DNA nucleotide flippase Atl1
MRETRRIGDQSITWKRVINQEGDIEDKETRHNVAENEKI